MSVESEKMAKARAAVRVAVSRARRRAAPRVEPAPRYDEVFERGTAWLDGRALPEVEKQGGEVNDMQRLEKRLARRRAFVVPRPAVKAAGGEEGPEAARLKVAKKGERS